MASTMDLAYRFIGVDAGAGAQFDRMAAKADATGISVGKFAAVAGAAAVTVIAGAVKMASDFEVAQTRLQVAVRNSGHSFADMTPQIDAADKRMESLGFTSTQTDSALALLTNATHSPTKAIADMGLAADIARGRHIDLADATQILVRVETGHAQSLGRLGIRIKDTSGHMLSQQQIVQELTDMYRNQASAYTDTFAGKVAVLRAQVEHVGVAIGERVIPVLETFLTGVMDVGHVLGDVAGFFEHNTWAAVALATAVGGPLVVSLARAAVAASADVWAKFSQALAFASYESEGASVALSGLGSVAGGLAFAGVGLLIGAAVELAIHTHSLASEMKDFGDKAREAFAPNVAQSMQAISDEYVKAADQITQKTDQMKHSFADFKNSKASGLLPALDTEAQKLYGDAVGEATRQQQLANTAYQQTITNLQTVQRATGDTRGAALQYAHTLGADLTLGSAAFDKQLRSLMGSQQAEASTSAQQTNSLAALAGAFKDAASAVQSLRMQYDLYVGSAFAVSDATAQFNTDLVDMVAKLKASKGATDLHTQAGRDARAAWEAVANDTENRAEAIYKETLATKGRSQALLAYRDAMNQGISTLKQYGGHSDFAREAMRRLNREVDSFASTIGPGATMAAQDVSSAIADALAGLPKKGEAAGLALVNGVADGIRANLASVLAASSSVATGAVNAMLRAAGIASPSKVTRDKVGMPLAEGVAAGMIQATAATDRLISSWLAGRISTLHSQAQAASAQLGQDLAARTGMSSQIVGSLTQGSALTSFIDPSTGQVGNIGAGLGAQLSMLGQFQGELRALQAKGLAPALLAQIAQAGPAQGMAVAQALLSGSAGISVRGVNAEESAINRVAGQIGGSVAGANFNPIIAADRTRVASIDASLKTMVRLQGEVAALLKQISTHTKAGPAAHIRKTRRTSGQTANQVLGLSS